MNCERTVSCKLRKDTRKKNYPEVQVKVKFGKIVFKIMMNPRTIIKREIRQAACNRRAWFSGSPNLSIVLSTRFGRSLHAAMFKSSLASHSCLDSL